MIGWAGAWGVSSLAESNATAPVVESSVVVGSRENDGRQGVDVVAAVGAVEYLRFDGDGIVTGLGVRAGELPERSISILEVDGKARYSYGGETPFYRDLAMWDQGNDVVTLVRFLASVGQLEADFSGDVFTPDVYWALVRFQQGAGLHADGRLRIDDFIYIPDQFGKVSSIAAKIGAPVPGDGVFAIGTGAVSKLDIRQSGGDLMPYGFDEEDSLQLVAGDVTQPVSSFRLTGDEAASIASLLDTWAANGQLTAVADEENIVYSGLQLSRAEPVRVGAVPNTALIGGPDGRTCVVLIDEKQRTQVRSVEAQVLPGEIGVSSVDVDLINSKVLRDPLADPHASHSCP